MARYELEGKVALITGAARGIGLATAQTLHARGMSVALIDLDDAATSTAGANVGERTLAIGADVTDAEAIADAVAWTVDRFGALDVCVANAGISRLIGLLRKSPAPEAVAQTRGVGASRGPGRP